MTRGAVCAAALFQHTAARRRLDSFTAEQVLRLQVSTHSRPKAAGRKLHRRQDQSRSFNTQPPEGGWLLMRLRFLGILEFQHTAARRRLGARDHRVVFIVRFNTQPPEGGWSAKGIGRTPKNSFNTQPPEGGWMQGSKPMTVKNSFNTQPPEGGWAQDTPPTKWAWKFQHTAARRRLEPFLKALLHQVSQPRFR